MLPSNRTVLKASPFRAVTALVRRDLAITTSYRAAFMLDLFFGVMNLIVFYFISRTVSLRAGDLQGAPNYFAFASVGVVLTVVMQAATTGVARRIREEQLTGTLEMLVMQPMSVVQLALGLTGFPFLFGVVRGAMYIAFGALFLDLPLADADPLGFAVVLAAIAITLSAIGIALGAVVLVLKQGEALASVVTFGFTLLSGALFPREVLPGWLEAVGDVLPTRFALDGLRHALFEGGGWHGHLLALVTTSLILIPLSLWFFSLLLSVVRKRGSLAHY